MAGEPTEEEKKGTTFLFVCAGIVLMVVGAAAWMALQGGVEMPETEQEEADGGGWHKLGRYGVLDISYMVESVNGKTVSLVRKAECTKGVCLDAMGKASAMMGDAEGADAPVLFETDMEVDCAAEQLREDDVRLYAKSGDLIVSDASSIEGWQAFEKYPKSSLDYYVLATTVCEKEIESQEDS